MNYLNRRVLHVDLSLQSFEIKTYPGLREYLGGLGLGLQFLLNTLENAAHKGKYAAPLIFSVGPLNGFFPYVSKTCILDYRHQLEEFYIGGALSSRIKFAGFDMLVFSGVSEQSIFLDISSKGVGFIMGTKDFEEFGLPGRSAKLAFFKDKLYLDTYFRAADSKLEQAFAARNLAGLNINSTLSYELEDISRYGKLYTDLLGRANSLLVDYGGNPSCAGCPMGCEKSQIGETKGNVLVHSLVACEYASPIYSDLGLVFSCLNALGYDYTHEELEKIPNLIKSQYTKLENLTKIKN